MAAVAAAKRKRTSKTSASHWGMRLAGVALCLFFALGVITGLSKPGRALAARVEEWFEPHSALGRSGIWPALFAHGAMVVPAAAVASLAPANPIALVRRADGFYVLDGRGVLRGPVAPAAQGDLPILSGAGVGGATPEALLEDAAMLVRAEADLNEVVSEMRVDGGGVATLYLERAPMEISFDFDRAGVEFRRAVRIIRLWRGHERMIAAIDLTEDDAAVVQIRRGETDGARRLADMRGVAYVAPERQTPRTGASR
jgi:hypothetical protein